MMTFQKRELEAEGTLGERLRAIREAAGVTIADLSHILQVKEEYLTWLEEGAYLKLPGDVFVKNFLRGYARVFEINPNRVLQWYEEERASFTRADATRVVERSFVKAAHHTKSINLWRITRIALGSLIVIAFVGYLVWQISNITKPPLLTIEEPQSDLITDAHVMAIRGVTAPEARLTINGEAATVDEQGRFSETVNLQTGLNEVTLVTQKKHSRAATHILTILVREP